MADSKFSVHGLALEACTRCVILPHHITEIPGAQHVDAVPQNFQPPPGEPAAAPAIPQLEVSSFLGSVLEHICDLQTFGDVLRYFFLENPGPDCDVPEADDDDPDDQVIKCSSMSIVPEGEPPTPEINHALEEAA